MKTLFYIGIVTWCFLEILKVYFIMPMPGSQQWDSVEFAYFIHQNRWTLRALLGIMILVGATNAFSISKKWIPILSLAPLLAIIYAFNFELLAEKMFKQPDNLSYYGQGSYDENDSSILVVIERDGKAKAYPIRYISYHHQVRDSIGKIPIMVTYCNVCRTGRIFSPFIDGKLENFRLVGMDHFNAMFEDETTGSWWQQATGEAIVGPSTGKSLVELESEQMTAATFFSLYPKGLIMKADEAFLSKYDSLGKFEKGKSISKLTMTDSVSWNEKSWVIGISLNGISKAYDWNDLKKEIIIHDAVGNQPIVLVLAEDKQSFATFKRTRLQYFQIKNDTLYSGESKYNLAGKPSHSETPDLEKINAYQEFWHSWRTFHPKTEVFKKENEENR
jgi:hypothetical protein